MKCGWVVLDNVRRPEFHNDLGVTHKTGVNKIVDWKQELNFLENEFKTEAEEILLKVDNFLITNRLSSRSLNSEETKKKYENVEKSFVGLKYEEMLTNRQENFRNIKNEKIYNNQEGTKNSQRRLNKLSSRELKQKILETCDIVDKGVQTAKELSEKFSTINLESNKVKKVENFQDVIVSAPKERIKNSKREKGSCSCLSNSKKCILENKNVESHVKNPGRNLLVEVTENSRQLSRKPKLQVQKLPSVDIKGGLQKQKIHNLEILPDVSDSLLLKPNTSVGVLSHEKIHQNLKLGEVKKVSLENCSVSEGDLIECTSCGNVLNIQRQKVNPQQVDEILEKCNFNIFDPRIEEFVCELMKSKGSEPYVSKSNLKLEETSEKKGKKECLMEKPKKDFRNGDIRNIKKKSNVRKSILTENQSDLRRLSEVLSKKYVEKAQSLQEYHLQLETILRRLLCRVSESKRFFDGDEIFSLKEHKEKRNTILKKPLGDCSKEVHSSDSKRHISLNKPDTVKINETTKKSKVRTKSKIKKVKTKKSKLKRSLDNSLRNLTLNEKQSRSAVVGSVINTVLMAEKAMTNEKSERDNFENLVEGSFKTENNYESDFENESLVSFPGNNYSVLRKEFKEVQNTPTNSKKVEESEVLSAKTKSKLNGQLKKKEFGKTEYVDFRRDLGTTKKCNTLPGKEMENVICVVSDKQSKPQSEKIYQENSDFPLIFTRLSPEVSLKSTNDDKSVEYKNSDDASFSVETSRITGKQWSGPVFKHSSPKFELKEILAAPKERQQKINLSPGKVSEHSQILTEITSKRHSIRESRNFGEGKSDSSASSGRKLPGSPSQEIYLKSKEIKRLSLSSSTEFLVPRLQEKSWRETNYENNGENEDRKESSKGLISEESNSFSHSSLEEVSSLQSLESKKEKQSPSEGEIHTSSSYSEIKSNCSIGEI